MCSLQRHVSLYNAQHNKQRTSGLYPKQEVRDKHIFKGDQVICLEESYHRN